MRRTELAVIDTSDNDLDQVTAIPDTGAATQPSTLIIGVCRSGSWSGISYQNSHLKMLSEAGMTARDRSRIKVPAHMIAVEPAPRATGVDERDVPSAAIEILPRNDGGSLGTWLVSDALGAPQTFSCGGRTWMIDAASGALLQALQRDVAEVHA